MSSYRAAGVDIDAGEEAVARIKRHAKSTFTPNVLSEIGLFGGFFRVPLENYREPVLVSSVDGVGTKLKIAVATGTFNTIGEDLVNHCVNDIAVCGAIPLFFLDYLAVGKLNPSMAEDIISGFAKACRENNCALIGGETAEMPGIYQEGDFDISGTIVGVVERKNIIRGENIRQGDVVIGFNSTGLHTNGYSLARKVLLERYKLTDRPAELGTELGQELLTVHRSYLPLIRKLIATGHINGLAHITGGGISGNTRRIIPSGLGLAIDSASWEVPRIFRLIAATADIPRHEMERVFNLGIGLTAVCHKEHAAEVMEAAAEPCRIIGTITEQAG